MTVTSADDFDPEWGASLPGGWAHNQILDNSKVKRLAPDYVASIPYERGAREIMAWYDAEPARRRVNDALNRIVEANLQASGRRSGGYKLHAGAS